MIFLVFGFSTIVLRIIYLSSFQFQLFMLLSDTISYWKLLSWKLVRAYLTGSFPYQLVICVLCHLFLIVFVVYYFLLKLLSFLSRFYDFSHILWMYRWISSKLCFLVLYRYIIYASTLSSLGFNVFEFEWFLPDICSGCTDHIKMEYV